MAQLNLGIGVSFYRREDMACNKMAQIELNVVFVIIKDNTIMLQ